MQEADKHDQKYNKCQKYNKHDHFFYIDLDNYLQYPWKKISSVIGHSTKHLCLQELQMNNSVELLDTDHDLASVSTL